MKLNITKAMLPMAVAAAFGAGLPGNAQADTIAVSYLGVSGFTLYSNMGTSTAFKLSDFVPGTLTIADQGTDSATLNGASSTPTPSLSTAFTTPFDPLTACVGGYCGTLGTNNFTQWTAAQRLTLQNLSYADSLLQGFPIDVGAGSVGATAQTIAVTSLISSGAGSASSELDLTSTFKFELSSSVSANTAGLGFLADMYLLPWTSAGTLPGTQAYTASQWTISLGTATGNIFTWSPTSGTSSGLTSVTAPCNINANPSNGPDSPVAPTQCLGSFMATIASALPAQDASHNEIQYSLSLTHKVSDIATTVPEPSTVALAGIALLGVWLVRPKRRRRTTA